MGKFGAFWKKFLSLLITAPRYVATVITASGSGEYTLQLLGGANIVATGAPGYGIGTKVFVIGSSIEGPAPSLTSGVIDV